MYEKHEENLCFSRVREGPGGQVGATWVPKSHLRGVRTAKNKVKRGPGLAERGLLSNFLAKVVIS